MYILYVVKLSSSSSSFGYLLLLFLYCKWIHLLCHEY